MLYNETTFIRFNLTCSKQFDKEWIIYSFRQTYINIFLNISVITSLRFLAMQTKHGFILLYFFPETWTLHKIRRSESIVRIWVYYVAGKWDVYFQLKVIIIIWCIWGSFLIRKYIVVNCMTLMYARSCIACTAMRTCSEMLRRTEKNVRID